MTSFFFSLDPQCCVHVMLEFVSPENVTDSIQLVNEVRRLPEYHKAKVDKLEVISWHSYSPRHCFLISWLMLCTHDIDNTIFFFIFPCHENRWRNWHCIAWIQQSKKYVSLRAISDCTGWVIILYIVSTSSLHLIPIFV